MDGMGWCFAVSHLTCQSKANINTWAMDHDLPSHMILLFLTFSSHPSASRYASSTCAYHQFQGKTLISLIVPSKCIHTSLDRY